MQTKLAHVPLSDITVSETNKMFRDEAELTDQALKELIDSIKVNGVISPVMLTPRPDGPTKYMLVAGERRFRASTFAGLKSIPSNIRELTDDQVLDVQLIENLERKDVHAAKEAKAYKLLMEKHPELTIADLALKFAKTEHYISIRLKLNDLVPEAMEDFSKDKMSIGHAMLIARLTPADQQEVVKEISRSYVENRKTVKYYDTIHELEEYINDSIICDLSTAAFKKDDATLLPKAGPCTLCPKRSGANQLFADLNDKDRCFDRTCFKAKRIKYLATQLPEILEKEPDIAFLKAWREPKVDPAIEKVLKDNKVKVLQPNTDYNTYNYGNHAKIKGIYINGDDVGKKVTVYSSREKAKGTGAKAQEKVSAKVAIARIKERTERAAELDKEKVYAKILTALKNHPTQEKPEINYYNEIEDAFMVWVLYDKLSYHARVEVDRLILGENDEGNAEDIFNAFLRISTEKRLFILRKVMLACYGGNMPGTDYAYFIQKIAEAYKDIPIEQFEAEQAAEREKREARAAERIEALQQPALKAKGVKVNKKTGLASLLREQKTNGKKKKAAADGKPVAAPIAGVVKGAAKKKKASVK